jgi:hypothetical protein
VVEWFSGRPASTLYLSVLTLGGLRKGIEDVLDAKRRMALMYCLETDLPSFFAGRLLPVDALVADRWGRQVAAARLAKTHSNYYNECIECNLKR